MSETNKSYRINTNVGEDKVVNVKLDQDYDVLEILSLKLTQEDVYKLHTSNYGIIAGRVLANGGFGIPNAKVSVFVQISDDDVRDPVKVALYPYNTTSSKDSEGRRYNLLPDSKINDCHQIIGTFPNKRFMLDNDVVLEIYDKYYSYTTRTNESGDYLIFGVPVGNQTVHSDLDLSDIGILSQRPRDLIYQGYNINQFENANQFKVDTNIDSLSQVLSQDSMVYVYPFWGDNEEGVISITRNDIQVQYVFEPTCVFMGSVVSDNTSNAIGKECIASINSGAMDELMASEGTIEMIRKTPDGRIEEFQIHGTRLINGSGVWCYQIPMNLDYVTTDEYGNMIPTDDPEKGIPTRAEVRFRLSLDESESPYSNIKRGKMLIPNNPRTQEELDETYEFGSSTIDAHFRSLFWNNVYSVKSFIPRFQKSNSNRNKKFTGFKHTNIYGGNNPIPYNNIRIHMPFMFSVICAIIKCIIFMTKILNTVITGIFAGIKIAPRIFGKRVNILSASFWEKRRCASIPQGFCEEREGWYYAPGCNKSKYWPTSSQKADFGFDNLYRSLKREETGEEDEINPYDYDYDEHSIDYKNMDEIEPICLTRKTDYLMQCVEIQLAQEYKVINFDFYNDWINGLVYIPQWSRTIRKKRRYFFGLFSRKARIQSCANSFAKTRKLTQQCALTYDSNGLLDDKGRPIYSKVVNIPGCVGSKQRCHKTHGRKGFGIFGRLNGNPKGGIIKEETVNDFDVYYYKPIEWNNGIRTILFATDIVLLGSLNDCDLHGVPQAFTLLSGSTYQMPSNLAFTNMDEDGIIYAMDDGGTRCSGQQKMEDSMIPVSQTYPAYQMYSKGVSIDGVEFPYSYEDEFGDTDGEEITEASGIDWGYTGPDQGDVKFVPKENQIYQPGGHFLGISCTNSETNVKSCINLSRICEVGVWMSQRQELPSRGSSGSDDLEYGNIIKPSGLISKDEVTDSDIRAMFATMNSNGLKTVIGNDGRLKYDFDYFYPNNFNGDLINYVNKGSTTYNERNPNSYGSLNKGRYVLENNDIEYYRYRLGQDPVFLLKAGERGQYRRFPMYENSFYFYFGIKDGQTALNEFNKQYYAVCAKAETPGYGVIISTKGTDMCNNESGVYGDGRGVIEVNLRGIDLPCSFSLYMANPENEITSQKLVASCGNDHSWNCSQITFENIWNGNYILDVWDNNNVNIRREFTVSSPIITSNILSTDFNEPLIDIMGREVYTKEEVRDKTIANHLETGGYLMLTDVSTIEDSTSPRPLVILVEYSNDGIPISYITNKSDVGVSSAKILTLLPSLSSATELGGSRFWVKEDGSPITNSDTDFFIPVWKGNTNYTLYVYQMCNRGDTFVSSSSVMKKNFFINAPSPLLLKISDSIIDHRFLKDGFNTGFFENTGGGSLKGWNQISNQNNYKWLIDVDKYGGTSVTDSNLRNRDAFIYVMKKMFWVDGVNTKRIIFRSEGGMVATYYGQAYFQGEYDEEVETEDSSETIIKLLEPTVVTMNNFGAMPLALPTLITEEGSSTLVYAKYDGTGEGYKTDYKVPYYGATSDESKILPRNVINDDANFNQVFLSEDELLKESPSNASYNKIRDYWFGVHFLDKPFRTIMSIWKPQPVLYNYGMNNSMNNSMVNGLINGTFDNAISVREKVGKTYLKDATLNSSLVSSTKYYDFTNNGWEIRTTEVSNPTYSFTDSQYLNLYGNIGDTAKVTEIDEEYVNLDVIVSGTTDDVLPSERDIIIKDGSTIPNVSTYELYLSEAKYPIYNSNAYPENTITAQIDSRVAEDVRYYQYQEQDDRWVSTNPVSTINVVDNYSDLPSTANDGDVYKVESELIVTKQSDGTIRVAITDSAWGKMNYYAILCNDDNISYPYPYGTGGNDNILDKLVNDDIFIDLIENGENFIEAIDKTQKELVLIKDTFYIIGITDPESILINGDFSVFDELNKISMAKLYSPYDTSNVYYRSTVTTNRLTISYTTNTMMPTEKENWYIKTFPTDTYVTATYGSGSTARVFKGFFNSSLVCEIEITDDDYNAIRNNLDNLAVVITDRRGTNTYGKRLI